MKKFIKWTLFILLLLAVAALVVCYFVIPDQARLFVDTLMGYLNKPVVIAGVSTTIGGSIAFVITKFIITSTKFGRKELNQMKTENAQLKAENAQFKEEISAKVTECEQNFDMLEQNCHNEVAIMHNEFVELQDVNMKALKTIPNKKVQAVVEKYEQEFDVRKEEIINKTIHTNEYIDTKIEELNAKFDAFIEELKNEEREEGINDQGTDEERA